MEPHDAGLQRHARAEPARRRVAPRVLCEADGLATRCPETVGLQLRLGLLSVSWTLQVVEVTSQRVLVRFPHLVYRPAG